MHKDSASADQEEDVGKKVCQAARFERLPDVLVRFALEKMEKDRFSMTDMDTFPASAASRRELLLLGQDSACKLRG